MPGHGRSPFSREGRDSFARESREHRKKIDIPSAYADRPRSRNRSGSRSPNTIKLNQKREKVIFLSYSRALEADLIIETKFHLHNNLYRTTACMNKCLS